MSKPSYRRLRPGRADRRVSARHPHAAATSLDALEPRRLLAATLAADGTLQVTGTEGPDQVTLRLGAEPNQIQVQEGTISLSVFLLDRVSSVSIDLRGGDDSLSV